MFDNKYCFTVCAYNIGHTILLTVRANQTGQQIFLTVLAYHIGHEILSAGATHTRHPVTKTAGEGVPQTKD